MNKVTGFTVAAFVVLAILVAFVNRSSSVLKSSSLEQQAAAAASETAGTQN